MTINEYREALDISIEFLNTQVWARESINHRDNVYVSNPRIYLDRLMKLNKELKWYENLLSLNALGLYPPYDK